jgi:hypothetical protein
MNGFGCLSWYGLFACLCGSWRLCVDLRESLIEKSLLCVFKRVLYTSNHESECMGGVDFVGYGWHAFSEWHVFWAPA